MASQPDATSRKCFPAILRRLLCSGSLPTHPSDKFTDSNIKDISHQNPVEIKSLKPEDNLKHAPTISSPGVVAKLMGLDSFPTPKDRTLGAYFRSRSVNSIDFLSHFDFDLIKKGNHQHRRVRTSASFREGLINDADYTSVVLLLEKVDENAEENQEELVIRRRADVKNRGNLEEKKIVANKPRKKLEIEERRTSQKKDLHGKTRVSLKERRAVVKPVNSEEELMGRKCVKRKKNKILAHNKLHPGCSMKKVQPEGFVPELARPVRSSKSLPSKIANSKCPCSSGANSDNSEGIRAITKDKDERKVKTKESSCYYKRMVEEICRMAEEDLKENWMVLKCEDFEEMCQQFGQEILDVLLRQFVDELVLLYGTRN